MMKLMRSVCLLGSCALVLYLSGCVPPQKLYVGNKVTAEQVPLAKEDSRAGSWETFDLKIAYNAETKDDVLDISGQITLGSNYQMTYDNVQSLDVYLFLLDIDSKVLLTEPLEGVFFSSTQDTVPFKGSYPVPAGTKAFSFGYSGVVADQTDHTSFYLLPLK